MFYAIKDYLVPAFKRAPWQTTGIMACEISRVFCSLATPYFLVQAFSHFVDPRHSDPEKQGVSTVGIYYLSAFGGALLTTRMLTTASRVLMDNIKTQYSTDLNHQQIAKFTEHTDAAEINTTPIGIFVQNLRHGYDAENALPAFIGDTLPPFLEFIGANIALLVIDWQLGLILIGIQAGNILIVCCNSEDLARRYEAQSDSMRMLFGKEIARIQDFENIHCFNQTSREISQALGDLMRVKNTTTSLLNRIELVVLGQGIWYIFSNAGLLALATVKMNKQQLPLPYYTMLLIYLPQLFNELMKFNRGLSQLTISINAIEKTDALLKKQPLIRSPENPYLLRLSQSQATINFNEVTFSHPEGRILDNATFQLAAGSKTAIVGLSGAGKSTIAQLLMRFYDPQAGSISIGNTDIKNLRLRSLRQIIGFVPQRLRLNNTTLRAALQYASKDFLSDERIFELLGRAGLQRLANPATLNQPVSENGVRLSGGELQRLAILRAYLKDPLIYVFDEPTSALDAQTSAIVQTLMDSICHNRTTLVITHHLLSVTNADNIIVIENGRIVQQGDFNTLKADQEGPFYRMLNIFCLNNGIDIETINATPRYQPTAEEIARPEKTFDDSDEPLTAGSPASLMPAPRRNSSRFSRGGSRNAGSARTTDELRELLLSPGSSPATPANSPNRMV
jgi:ATP-binding cassette, subfamily B, bacterial AbcA/BmrA